MPVKDVVFPVIVFVEPVLVHFWVWALLDDCFVLFANVDGKFSERDFVVAGDKVED